MQRLGKPGSLLKGEYAFGPALQNCQAVWFAQGPIDAHPPMV